MYTPGVYDSFGNRLSEADRNAAGTIIASTHAAAVDTIFGYTGRQYPCKALLKPGANEENSQSTATNLNQVQRKSRYTIAANRRFGAGDAGGWSLAWTSKSIFKNSSRDWHVGGWNVAEASNETG